MFWPLTRVRVTVLILIMFLSFGAGRSTAQNLLTNGDFENIGTITLNNGFSAVGTGGLIPGWTTTAGSAANANVYIAAANSGANWIPNPEHGTYAIQLDSTSNNTLRRSSTISQTVTVNAGGSYLLSFWFNTEVKANLTSIIQTTLSGAFASTNTYSTTAGATITQASAVWVHVTQTFTATTSGNLTILFSDISTSDSNAALDDVSLTAVPEPATCLAGAFALGLVGWRVRSRRLAPRLNSNAMIVATAGHAGFSLGS